RWRKRLKPALSRVRLIGQRHELVKECWRLADKQPHVSEKTDHSFGNSLWIRGANHGATRKFCADEFAGNGKDQVGLQRWVERLIEVREGNPGVRIGQRGKRRLHTISRKVHPLQEVSYFVTANADHDFQNLHIVGLLGQG